MIIVVYIISNVYMYSIRNDWYKITFILVVLTATLQDVKKHLFFLIAYMKNECCTRYYLIVNQVSRGDTHTQTW